MSEKISGMNLQKEMPKPASKALELLPTILVILGVIVVIAIVYAIIQFANHKTVIITMRHQKKQLRKVRASTKSLKIQR